MPFLSEFLNNTVRDSRSDALGKCFEVYVNSAQGFPAIVALGLLRGGQEYRISALDIAHVDHKGITLGGRLRDLTLYEPQGNEIGLRHQVLDRQIIDINGKRVVRVNDLQFAFANGRYRLVAVDTTPLGAARRLGVDRPVRKLFQMGGRGSQGLIAWDQVDPTAIGPAGIPLKVSRNDLAKMHEADLADIVEELDIEAGDYVLSTLDTEVAADTLQEMEPERRVSALESIEPERAADILEAMEPDEAADVLGDISADRAADLLSRMDKDEAEDVRELLAYPEESAGGIMTNEFISIAPHLNADQTLKILRTLKPDAKTAYYLYVADEDEKLLGVISLRDLVVAEPEDPIRDFMVSPVIHVEATDSQEEVAGVLAKYNLLAVPVTDAEQRILGIVTVDDAIDAVPGAWKRRIPRVFS